MKEKYVYILVTIKDRIDSPEKLRQFFAAHNKDTFDTVFYEALYEELTVDKVFNTKSETLLELTKEAIDEWSSEYEWKDLEGFRKWLKNETLTLKDFTRFMTRALNYRTVYIDEVNQRVLFRKYPNSIEGETHE